MRRIFFHVMSLHRWLLGSSDGVGKTITGVSTLVFVFILITGIILWWLKNKEYSDTKAQDKTKCRVEKVQS